MLLGFAIHPTLFWQLNNIDSIDMGEGVENIFYGTPNKWKFGKTSQQSMIAGLLSMKQLAVPVFLPLTGWDGSPSQGYLLALNSPVPI